MAKFKYIVKVFAKKCLKNYKIYIFKKPMTMPFQIGKFFFKNLMCNYVKLKMCKFLMTG